MRKFLCAVLVAGLLVGPALPAAEPSAANSGECKNTKCCKCSDEIIYPSRDSSIDASYVGGTIPGMELKQGTWASWPLRVVGLWKRQYRVKGRVVLTRHHFFFVFKGEPQTTMSGPAYEVEPCKSLVEPSEAAEACRVVSGTTFKQNEPSNGNNTDPSGDTQEKQKKEWHVISIKYRDMAVLSRAKVNATDLSSVATLYASTSLSILSTVIGVLGKAHDKQLYGGITAGTLALGYYFLVAHPRSGDNYIALFVKPSDKNGKDPAKMKPSGQGSTAKTASAQKQSSDSATMVSQAVSQRGILNINSAGAPTAPASSPDSLFTKGDVIMFKIPNSHDYYNISMILSGKTGKEFVSELAEKTGK